MKTISLVVLFFFSSSTVFAYQCSNPKGDLKPCEVSAVGGNLIISSKEDLISREIKGKNITNLSGGQYARRRVGESVGLAVVNPLFLFMLFSKKKRSTFGVEYKDDNGNPSSIMIAAKKKNSKALQAMLQSISGKEVKFQ